jgi:hypothetical protein
MIDQFNKEDFETYLQDNYSPINPLGLVDGEETYEILLDNQTSVTIRSSIKADGLSADVGKDSIRCWLMNGDKPLGSKVSKWTTRQPGWQERLTGNIDQLVSWRALAGDCKECDKPKGIFKAKTEKNKGRPFARCNNKKHKSFVWLDKPINTIKTSDIYFSEESHDSSSIQNDGNEDMASGRNKKHNTGKNKPILPSVEQDTRQDFTNSNIVEKVTEQTRQKRDLSVLPIVSAGIKKPNNQQKQAIEADIEANLRVLAGPGSGKSKVIEWRYEYLVGNGVNPDKIVVCTFGKPAATEIGQRIAKTCPQANLEQICTINALCYRLLAKWFPDSRWYKWQGPKDWQIKKTLEDVIGPLWQEKEKPSAQEVYNYINTSKYLGLTTDDSYEWFVDVLGQRYGNWLYEIRSKFDAWLNRSKFMTFADQLFLVEQQLKNDPTWRSMVQERFSHVIVDEGQDTNYQAMKILITISLEPGQNTVYESEER